MRPFAAIARPNGLLRALLVVVTGVLLATSCSDGESPAGGSDAAFVVNDTSLSRSELNEQLADWVTLVGEEGTVGEGAETYNQEFVANRLSLNVQYAALADELAARDIEVSAEHRATAQADVDQQVASLESEAEANGETFVPPTESFVTLLVEWTAVNTAALEETTVVSSVEVAEEDIEAAYAEYPESICSSHILVETEEEAVEIKALIEAGGDFAALAGERSIDPGSGAQGGDLGCVPLGSFVPEFEQAAIAAQPGVVTDPIESEFGFHLIVVGSVGVPELDDVRADIEAQLTGAAQQETQLESQTAFETLFEEAVANAEISVDTRYGEWDPEAGAVIPPEGATPATTEPPAVELLPEG